jgi:hypothetical protein
VGLHIDHQRPDRRDLALVAYARVAPGHLLARVAPSAHTALGLYNGFDARQVWIPRTWMKIDRIKIGPIDTCEHVASIVFVHDLERPGKGTWTLEGPNEIVEQLRKALSKPIYVYAHDNSIPNYFEPDAYSYVKLAAFFRFNEQRYGYVGHSDL